MKFGVGNNSLSLAAAKLYYSLVLPLIGSDSSVFYYNPTHLECGLHGLQQSELPQWRWNTQLPYAKLREQHNSEIYVIACLPEKYDLSYLMALASSLNHLKEARIIIEMVHNVDRRKDYEQATLAAHILKHCQAQQLLNVLLYFQRSMHSVYGYEAFPHFTLIEHPLKSIRSSKLSAAWYPNELLRLKGAELKIMHDFYAPTSVEYRAKDGRMRIGGFLWHFVCAFADKLQAKLNLMYPTWPAGRYLEMPYMLELTNNGSIDLGVVVKPLINQLSKRFYQYSYPLLQGSWCVMLPIEAPIESNAVLGRLSDMKTLLLLLLVIASAGGISLCQIDIYRRLPRCLHCLKLLPGLLLLLALCLPQAQYEALMVRRPRMKFLANFNDLLASNVRIKCLRSDFDGMGDAFRAKYADAFRLTDNLTEVHAMRGNFNTNWAYLIPTFNWIVLQSQQQYFQRPLFRYSDLCIFTFHQYSAIIAENSIYRRSFDQHIMRSQQSGLLMHWMRHSYYDMVASGHMQFKDLSVGNSRAQWPLALNDLRTLFSCYIACILLTTLVLLIELLYFYGKLCLNNL